MSGASSLGRLTASLLAAIFAAVASAHAQEPHVLVVSDAASLRGAAAAAAGEVLADAPEIEIRIEAGTYVLEDSFRILRSGVFLNADRGAIFRLADRIDKPVVAIGSQDEVPPESARVRRIRISGLTVDGNMEAQTAEVGDERPWIRNNGIDVRRTSELLIENVHVRANRSGGLVVSWGSDRVRVKNSLFSGNYFDGVAYYDSDRIETLGCRMEGNHSAGISLDNHFANSRFVDCEIRNNGDVGIFIRASENIVFDRCVIESSGDWGAFLAHDESDRGVHGVRFVNCKFIGNRGGLRMASVNELQSSGTEVIDCRFSGNHRDGRANIDSAGSKVRAESNREER